ncbi:MAG TPA: ABC transporter substrate-binding protein [Gammaproteobacteria bacterium]|nr:ABC transporter substrate-binding protein [Gammaproteobacteria bacterium]
MKLYSIGKRFLGALLLASVVVSGCDRPAEDNTPKLQKITIAQFGHVFLYLPLYVAKNKGFFKEQGIDVTLVSTGGDEKTFAAVSSGSAQFGVADPVFTAIARERGQGGKVVASVVNGVAFWGITFRDDISPIQGPEGFAKLRVAAYTAPSTNYTVMKKVLQNSSGTPVDATIVEGAFGSLVAMLKADQADVAMELEPVASIAVASGAKVVYSLAESFGDFAFTGLTVTDQYLQSKPETVQAAVTALAKAADYIYADFEGAFDVAVHEFPDIDKSILRNALRRLIDDHVIPRSVVLSEESWNKAVDLRKEVGDIKSGGAYAENVDMTFARKAELK